MTTFRSLNRRLTRHATRMTNGGPRPRPANHLAHALLAFQKVIRARRRLMRLAPSIFDQAVVDRETAGRAQSLSVQADCELALAKVYGPAASTNAPASGLCPPLCPWPRSRRIWRAVARELAVRELWLEIGRAAFQRFQTRQFHARLSLSTIGRLLSVADGFGRLSTGLDTNQPKDSRSEEGAPGFYAALHRIYGKPELTGAKT